MGEARLTSMTARKSGPPSAIAGRRPQVHDLLGLLQTLDVGREAGLARHLSRRQHGENRRGGSRRCHHLDVRNQSHGVLLLLAVSKPAPVCPRGWAIVRRGALQITYVSHPRPHRSAPWYARGPLTTNVPTACTQSVCRLQAGLPVALRLARSRARLTLALPRHSLLQQSGRRFKVGGRPARGPSAA